MLLAVLAIIVGVIFVQQALRKIPIQYAKRVRWIVTMLEDNHTHLPLKVNAAGVIPVIFAIVIYYVHHQRLLASLAENRCNDSGLSKSSIILNQLE